MTLWASCLRSIFTIITVWTVRAMLKEPVERPRLHVVFSDEIRAGIDQIPHAGRAAELFGDGLGEQAFDLLQPRRTRGEMQMIAWPFLQPPHHFRVFVCSGVL